MKNSSSESKEKIWQVVAAIPPGRVCTYGKVAHLAGLGKAARFVGRTLKYLPAKTTLPWHRVINAQGKISFPVNSESYLRQTRRLEAEGITITASGRVALRVYGWPDEA